MKKCIANKLNTTKVYGKIEFPSLMCHYRSSDDATV